MSKTEKELKAEFESELKEELHNVQDLVRSIKPNGIELHKKQVGGSHYSRHSIQPWDIIVEWDLNFFEGNVLKYLLRRKGNRLEDLEKIAHYVEKMIELEEENES